jgi:hypothetical protein
METFWVRTGGRVCVGVCGARHTFGYLRTRGMETFRGFVRAAALTVPCNPSRVADTEAWVWIPLATVRSGGYLSIRLLLSPVLLPCTSGFP